MNDDKKLSNRARRTSRHRELNNIVYMDTSQKGVSFEIKSYCPSAILMEEDKYVFKIGTSSATHPAYVKGTKHKYIDVDKRIDVFNRRYGNWEINKNQS